MKNRTSFEFFAGTGGMALGFEESGFENNLVLEIDKNAIQTLKLNRPNWNILNEDIIKFSENIENYINKEITIDLDLISGGFPCQAFSFAGSKLGLDDARGTLFYYLATIIDKLKPKTFVAENVKGLTIHDGGKTINIILETFKSIGYSVEYKILNANDYGVAQKRERIFIVGIRKDLKEKENYSFNFPKPQEYKPVLRDILFSVPESKGSPYSDKKKKIFSLLKEGQWWKHLPDDIAKAYMGKSYQENKQNMTGLARRMSMSEPSLTIMCSPSQNRTERCHPTEIRPFTIRESARIQSFPDNWEFSGSISNQYKQVGNAVPVLLAKAVGDSIKEYLDNNQF